MISDIKRSVAAAYQLKIQAPQISQLIKYNQLLQLKYLGFYLIWKTCCQKVMFCVREESVLSNRVQSRLLKVLQKVLLSLRVELSCNFIKDEAFGENSLVYGFLPLTISQNSLEDTCATVSFLIKLLKKRLWHACFPVNFAKFLRTSFLQNTFGDCFCQ